MLRDNGIYDVTVTSTSGMLTDHYNPMNKTVNLSEGVYGSASVAAAAVAAHECGHAVQHARGYAPLRMRSALVPVVQFSSSIVSWVLLAGILMVNSFPQLLLYRYLSVCHDHVVQFHYPSVEIDASRRALVWLSSARNYQCVQSSAGYGCLEVGCLYVCRGSFGFTGYADLLRNDLYESSRVSMKSFRFVCGR